MISRPYNTVMNVKNSTMTKEVTNKIIMHSQLHFAMYNIAHVDMY